MSKLQDLGQLNITLNDSFKVLSVEVHKLRSENRSLSLENTYSKNMKDSGVKSLSKSEASLTVLIAKNNAIQTQSNLQIASYTEELKEARSRLYRQQKIFILREESLLRQINSLKSPLCNTKSESIDRNTALRASGNTSTTEQMIRIVNPTRVVIRPSPVKIQSMSANMRNHLAPLESASIT